MTDTIGMKLFYSFLCAIIFIAASHPKIYSLITTDLVGLNNCPTAIGHFTQTLIFFVLSLILMVIINLFKSENKKTFGLMIKYSFYGTLIFYLISNKEIYKLTGDTLGSNIAKDGCATTWGVLLHAFVFMLVKFGVMFLPKDIPYVKISTNDLSKLTTL